MKAKEDEHSLVAELGGLRYRLYIGRIRSNEQIAKDDSLYHSHVDAELHYVYAGTEQIFYKGKLCETITPGVLCVISPNVFHATASKSVSRLCFMIGVESMSGAPLPTLPKDLYTVSDPLIVSMMERYRSQCDGKLNDKLGTRESFLLMSAALQVLSDTFTPREPSDRLHKIHEYVTNHLADAPRIDKLAKLLSLSERRTSALVCELTGQDFRALVTRQRMLAADMMLQQGERSLEEIALLVGYRSYSGFYTAFRSFFGYNPRKVKRASKNSKSAPR